MANTMGSNIYNTSITYLSPNFAHTRLPAADGGSRIKSYHCYINKYQAPAQIPGKSSLVED